MGMRKLWFLLAVFTLLMGESADIVNKDGKMISAIVVPENAKDAEMLAANEIKRFVAKASGLVLPVKKSADAPAIYVGNTPLLKKYGIDTAGFIPDEFIVKSVPEGLIVAGRDYSGGPITGLRHPFNLSVVWKESLKLSAFGSSGTLFAAYAFLEECFGIRFYMPGELGIVIPELKKDLVLDKIDFRRKPEFRYRNIYYMTMRVADEDNCLWYKQLGLGGEAPVQLNHSFRYLEDIAKANPEFYGILNGKRHAGPGFTVSESQYCLSNPEFRKKVAEYICQYFKDNPDHRIFPLVPGDGCNRICECDKCQSQLRPKLGTNGEFSFHVWDFINEVAKEVYKKYPQCSVGGLAYGRYFTVPEEVKLHPSVSVMICRQRSFNVVPAYEQATRENIMSWAKQTKNIFFWDYYLTLWRPPWSDYPVLIADVAQKELRFMSEQGFGGEFVESPAPRSPGQTLQISRPGMQHLNIYLTAKLYWNTKLDMDALLNEYYKLFYGPAEREMKTFWETGRRCWHVNGAKNFISKGGANTPEARATTIFSANDMADMNNAILAAMKKVPADSVYGKRIKMVYDEFKNALERHGVQLKFKPQSIAIYDKSVKAKRHRFLQKDGRKSEYPTYAEISYDQKNLYVKLIAFEPDMKNLRTLATKDHDGKVASDDCFEIFVNGNVADRHMITFYQIDLNANGAHCGWIHPVGSTSGNRNTWKSPAKVVGKRFGNRWEAEVIIPLDKVLLPVGRKGNSFSMNIYRMRISSGPNEVSSLIPTFTFVHRDVDKFCQIDMK